MSVPSQSVRRPHGAPLRAERPEIERAITLLFQPGDVVEVRIPKTRAGVVAGYFDDFRHLLCSEQTKSRPSGEGLQPAQGIRSPHNRRRQHSSEALASC
jgi:hypothetical protein